MNDDDEDNSERVATLLSPEMVVARDAVGKAISTYLTLLRPDETPYVTAWAVAAEWTNTELEQNAQAGRDIIAPMEQTISACGGLGHYLADRFSY